MLQPWPKVAIGAAVLIVLLSHVGKAAKPPPPARLSFSPGFRGLERCPQRCSLAGPHPGNWSLYHNIDQTDGCGETMFMGFSLYDAVDDASMPHRIFACASYGSDWANLPSADNVIGKQGNSSGMATTATSATFQLGWGEGGGLSTADIRSMSRQLRDYLKGNFRPLNETFYMLAKSNKATIGLYLGRGLHNARTGQPALQILESTLQQLNGSNNVALQLCNDDSEHIFGVMASSNDTFDAVQNALQTWSNGSCVAFPGGSMNFTSEVVYLTPPPQPLVNNTISWNASSGSGSHGTDIYKTTAFPPRTHHTSSIEPTKNTYTPLRPRDECRIIKVNDGDTCEKLARKCGIRPYDFTQYNPDPKLCSSLMKGMHVCCSAGQRPSFKPNKNSDGTCATHKVDHDETCASLAASYDLTVRDIDNFNSNTWEFNGCGSNLLYEAIICLSEGTPPMPLARDGVQCGPQKPGTPQQPANVNLNTLNPCPLNACCDVWGSCGTTSEYCTNTSTSAAPGSAAPNTNGCISNCGTELKLSSPPAQFLSVGYYEGYQFDRTCLYQDPQQIDTSKFTHIHYAFATIASDYSLNTGDVMSTYAFKGFQRLKGVRRIVSFGGWGFSTSSNTYDIFRQGVKSGNREQLAANVARFVENNNLDGVDFDWEYPGAYDIPGIPPPIDGKDEGPDYLEFLKLVRQLLPNKSISIAVSSSYWYLRNFPIAEMSQVVDYVVYMTYDLHGQWDASTKWSQSGCDTGTCLRSHVNLTETISSLIMVTKAGVPSNKIIVGVSSYGRSFNMVDGNCWTNMCQFTGTATQSDAKPGVCTGVGGYIADAEIKTILSDRSRVKQSYVDADSDSNILVYDDNQWVSYMDSHVRSRRTNRYQQLNMGGTANWAIDLEDYTESSPLAGVPWDIFILGVKANGGDDEPSFYYPRTGIWTSLTCDDRAVTHLGCYRPSERWAALDCDNAWSDAINSWNHWDHTGKVFSQSIGDIYHVAEGSDCGSLATDANCDAPTTCFAGVKSGPAGYLIWNSIVSIHEMYKNYHDELMGDTYNAVMNSLKGFENIFAPVPPKQSTLWVDILMSIITIGLTAVAAPFFNGVLKGLDYFEEHEIDSVAATAYAIIASTASVSGTVIKGSETDGTWTATDQDTFSTYIGQVMSAWGNATQITIRDLMNGSTPSTNRITDIISDGKLIAGSDKPGDCHEGGSEFQSPPGVQDAINNLKDSTSRSIFAFAIPALWSLSGLRPFVLDTGDPCNTHDPLPDFMTTDTMHKTAGCYDDKLYYLVMPSGNAVSCDQSLCNLGSCSAGDCHHNKFIAPTGLDSLVLGNPWGNFTPQLLIAGAVRTYKQNANQNGGGVADPSNRGTLDDLMNSDFTTPGFIRIPVCSPDMAFKAWERGFSSSLPNYPCASPPATKSYCGDSTFVDQTSNASPLVSDCQHIIENIEGTDGDYQVKKSQRQILQYGTCAFGVQGNTEGARVTNQDAIDIIHDSIGKYGGSGKISAKGTMSCGATSVDWGIYTNPK